jgi:NADPH:quinone reductase-like Zn-dependent oxidoreductase
LVNGLIRPKKIPVLGKEDTKMKAIVYEKYGPPDVLHPREVEKPAPKADEVLIQVHAASVNWGDWHNLRADPFLVRLAAGLLKPKNKILGFDVAGRVETVGVNVKQFQPGDEVFGDIYACGGGAFAEYVAVPENALVLKPANITFEQAAAVPVAAVTALQGLRDQGQIRAGQKVLINGASGGVGTFAVRLARHFGAEVTGVCSARNVNLVRRLGADHVVDYTQEDITQNGQRFDLILDNVGNPSIYKRLYKHSLSPKGICVIVAGSFFLQLIQGPWMTLTGGNKIGTFMTVTTREDLAFIQELLETGEIVPVIDRCYPLSEVPEAIRYLEEGHARGKLVISHAWAGDADPDTLGGSGHLTS